MSRPRVTLYDFVPYGAPELLEVRETYLTRALATSSSGLIVLFAIAFAASAWFASHTSEHLAPIGPIIDLLPPPLFDLPPVAPEKPQAPIAKQKHSAAAEMVPDAAAPPDQPIASQEDLRQSALGNIEGTNGSAEPVAPSGNEPIPGRNDWVYYEDPPVAITQVKPVYPDLAREAGVDGTVMLRVLVGKDGRVMDVHVDRSIPMLDGAAVAAARQWVFTPALSNGHPVMVWVAVPIRFTLHH